MFRQNFLSVSKAGECTGYHHQRIVRQGYSVWQVPFIFWNRDISSDKCPSRISAPPPPISSLAFRIVGILGKPVSIPTLFATFWASSTVKSVLKSNKRRCAYLKFPLKGRVLTGRRAPHRGGRPCYFPVLILLFQGIR